MAEVLPEGDDLPGDWEAWALGDRLVGWAREGHVLRVSGLTLGHLHRDLPQVRARLAEQQVPLYTLDPTGVFGRQSTFVDVLHRFVEYVEERGELSEEAAYLFDFVASAGEQARAGGLFSVGGKLYTDALCRLWVALVANVPAVLVVLNGHRLAASQASTLEHLGHNFYQDPLGELAPEATRGELARGALVYLDAGGAWPFDVAEVATKEFDLRPSAVSSVEAFLREPAVVERFVRSTGGDLRRLGELVASLPEDVESFWLFRYERLSGAARDIIDLLVVAGESLSAETVNAALESLGQPHFVARAIRDLLEQGFIRRKIALGEVRLQVDNGDFSEAVRGVLCAERERQCHRALAEAESRHRESNRSARFLARHFIAAGDVERGVHYGMDAAQKLLNQRAWDDARLLLEQLAEHADDVADIKQVHAWLIEVYTALGEYRRALAHCMRAEGFAESARERADLACRTGALLVETGDWEEADAHFAAALEEASGQAELSGLRVRAALGRGESLYASGEHGEAEELAMQVIELVEGERVSRGKSSHQLDTSLIHARNLIAKIAIFRGNFDDARKLLGDNQALARAWGWRDERARAEANLGLVALQQHAFDEAQERLEAAQELACSPAIVSPAQTWLNLGMVYQHRGRFEQSLDYYLKSLRSALQSGDEVIYDVGVYNLATLYQTLGAFERAYEILGGLSGRDVPSGFLGSLPALARGAMLLDEERFAEALEQFSAIEAKRLDESSAHVLPAAEAQLRSVEAHFALDQGRVAERTLEAFVSPSSEDRQRQLEGLYHYGVALKAFRDGEYAHCVDIGRMARDELTEAGHDRDARRAALLVGRAMVADGREAEARALLERELRSLQEKAQYVPEYLRNDYFRVPVHQALVEVVRELSGEVPSAFELPAESTTQETSAGAEGGPDQKSEAFHRWRSRYPRIVGEDERVHQILRIIDRVADSESPVLLLGESGTGKELVAEALHEQSARSQEPLIKVNCAAFVEDLLLSELFGHVKGAFTGALADKAGRFEMADGGTIFLDEIGDISPKTQVALLRVLQEKTYEKVGGGQTHRVDVRVICATNKHLEEMVERGEFRLDLYYRLKGVIIDVPALRNRRKDIPRLVRHFVERYASRPVKVSQSVHHFLASYSWPGNVRELQNFVRSILLFVEGDQIEMDHVREFSEFFSGGEVDLELPAIDYDVAFADYELGAQSQFYEDPEGALVDQIVSEGLSLSDIKRRLELESIRRALTETGGNITRAAEILQMKRPRLSQIVNSTEELRTLKEQLVS